MFLPQHKERVHMSYIFHCLGLLVHKQLHLAISNGRDWAAKKIIMFLTMQQQNQRGRLHPVQFHYCSPIPAESHPSMGTVTCSTHSRDVHHVLHKWKLSITWKVILSGKAAAMNSKGSQTPPFSAESKQGSYKDPLHSSCLIGLQW